MEALAIYLLKMIVCSGLLYGYYRMALYNEKFHQWNRFYLLCSLLLSVVVPLINIPLFTSKADSNLAIAISALPWNVPVESFQKPALITAQELLIIAFFMVTIVFFIRFISGIVKLIACYKTSPVTNLNQKVRLILTNIEYAPFSFFSWLFWRQDIDPATETGQRILTHELTHISQRHSLDKIATELLLCLFWMNPFFWLIRRELSVIHEFIADHKAIGKHNGAAFAAMILQAMQVQPLATNGLVNPLFSSQIKRRLLMITSSKEPKYSYLRRLNGLVLMIGAILLLTLTIQNVEAQKKDKALMQPGAPPQKVVDSVKSKKIAATKIGQKNKAADSISFNNSKAVGALPKNPLYIYNGRELSKAEIEDIKPDSIAAINILKGEKAIEIYGQKGKEGVVVITSKGNQLSASNKLTITGTNKLIITGNDAEKIKPTPLIYVDGKAINSEEMEKIKPNDIESVNVLKGESAINKYGEKGKDGVIEITMRKKV